MKRKHGLHVEVDVRSERREAEAMAKKMIKTLKNNSGNMQIRNSGDNDYDDAVSLSKAQELYEKNSRKGSGIYKVGANDDPWNFQKATGR